MSEAEERRVPRTFPGAYAAPPSPVSGVSIGHGLPMGATLSCGPYIARREPAGIVVCGPCGSIGLLPASRLQGEVIAYLEGVAAAYGLGHRDGMAEAQRKVRLALGVAT